MHVFSLDGETWTTDDYTLAEMAELEDRLDCRWGEIEPKATVKHTLCLLTVWMRRTRSEDATAKILGDLRLGDMEHLVTWGEGDDLPVGWDGQTPTAGASETTGSSGAPSATGGLPASPEASRSAT